jgi:hypothetical protein
MSFVFPLHRADPDDTQHEGYRLVAVESAVTPEGCAGLDWFVYRIAREEDRITGYRRGTRESVRTDAETIVGALNERRVWNKPKPNPKERRRIAAAARAAVAEEIR